MTLSYRAWVAASAMLLGVAGCLGAIEAPAIEADATDASAPATPDAPSPPEPPEDECPSVYAVDPNGGCIQSGVHACAAPFLDDDGRCRPTFDGCPPGTMPRIDQGCVPVGIDGCAEVFMGDRCAPGSAACPPGSIADPQLGCVPALQLPCAASGDGAACLEGAAACPAGHVPTDWGFCAAVGPASCAAGALQDGLCAPSTASCGDGWRATPSEGCAPLDGPGCDAGFGGLEATPGAVFVDPTFTGAPNGSAAAPFFDIASALAAAPPGGTVLLAAGWYDEPLLVMAPVTIRGRCASLVTIAGAQSTETPFDAVALVTGAQGVTIEDVRLSGDGIGLLASDAGVTLRRVLIDEALGAGALALGLQASLHIADSLIRGTRSTGQGAYGRGVDAEGGASALVERTTITGNREVGLFASGTDTTVVARDVLVEGTLPLVDDGTFGRGVVVQNGATLTLEDSVVKGNRDVGVFVGLPFTKLTVRRSVVRETAPRDSDDAGGRGIVVGYGAQALLEDLAVIDNHEVGIFVSDFSTEAIIARALVRGTLPRPSDERLGVGVSVEVQARATLMDVLVLDNHEAGVAALDEGTVVSLDAVVVQGTQATPREGAMGIGLEIADGAVVFANHLILLENHRAALRATGLGSTLDATDVIAHDTRAGPKDGRFGASVAAFDQASVTLTGAWLRESREVAVAAAGAGTLVTLTRTLVDDTLPSAGGLFGRGVDVEDGARVALSGVAVRKSRDTALFAHGPGSEITAESVLIEDTLPQASDLRYGRGVNVQAGGRVELTGSVITRSRDVAAFVSGLGSELALTDSIIGETAPQEADGIAGRGVQAQGGATVTLTRSIIRDSHDIGVASLGIGTKITADTTLIDGVSQGAPGARGYGYIADGRARIELGGCTVRGAASTAVLVHGADAVLSATLLTETGAPGYAPAGAGDGLLVVDGSSATVSGTIATACQRAGLAFDDSEGTVMASESHANGFGIALQGDARPVVGDDNIFKKNKEKDVLEDGGLSVPSDPLPPETGEETVRLQSR